ncbi:hypothetical protein QTQ03_24085 [Micromonospora sp. WMMA1363]|uniref:DUF7269 family protein n=1 Tax=Micromonospora sp. WMMA1363 TaxID=3053985 RepID=UPI00259CED27|nr:hypothetical protein [Micromonospora sp. WMMA1363]MDM4722520.1 hypothetical protein [Micromonospora sp. WMMA1363]
MSGTSIDDLLTAEEDGPSRRPRSGRRSGQVLRAVLAVAAAVVVLAAGLRVLGLQVSPLVLVAAVAALIAVRRVVSSLAPPRSAARTAPKAGRSAGGPGTGDALRTAINGWERPLDWASGDRERFAERILPRLGELTDERLRQRHGLTRDSDPARARALLGEPLWTFLAAPSRRTPSPRALAAIVAELEKI